MGRWPFVTHTAAMGVGRMEVFNDDYRNHIVYYLVSACAKRSRLVFRLLSLQPQLTDMQMAALWFYTVWTMDKAFEEKKREIPVILLQRAHSISREFFDGSCQAYVNHTVGSSLELNVSSTVIHDNASRALEAMSPQFRTDAADVIVRLGGNAHLLAEVTGMLFRFTRDQIKYAQELAVWFVASDKSLNSFERETTLEWLTEFWSLYFPGTRC
jgi:hypothetical protein